MLFIWFFRLILAHKLYVMAKEDSYHNKYFKDHQIKTYVPNNYQKMLTGMAFDRNRSKSETASIIIQKFFDGMPESVKEHYLKKHETMTSEQRKNPKNTY